MFYQNKQTQICSNCGGTGHTFRFCQEPVSSYGVLVFRWISRTKSWPHTTKLSDTLIPQVLMIQRKDSLGFMDIMRGKYKVNEPEYIKKQLRGMTGAERQKLETMDFEEIWHLLWGSDTESSQRYAHDRVISRQKLAELRAGIELPTGERYTLSDLLRQEPILYETPEWGFPKGRRDPYETDIQCAFRELTEETSICESELLKAINVAPLIEQFHGSNGVHYRHSYYVAQYIGKRNICFNALNQEMAREIGDLKWMNLDDVIPLLRPENVEKKTVLSQLTRLLKSYSPVIKIQLSGLILEENNGEEQQEYYVFTNESARDERSNRIFGTRQTTRRVSNVQVPGSERGVGGGRIVISRYQ